MDPNGKFIREGIRLKQTNQYRRLISKLIYLTITRPDIYFTVQILSQFKVLTTIDMEDEYGDWTCYQKEASLFKKLFKDQKMILSKLKCGTLAIA